MELPRSTATTTRSSWRAQRPFIAVNVAAVPNQKGWFNVEYKGKSYLMAPESTTTGAVRLEDKKNGMMWLQIANKSMLMNSKIGQRMVDNCLHPEQRAAVRAVEGAAASERKP